MADQYDAIATKYGSMKDLPAPSLELPSVDAVIGDMTGLRCLDLASGLGRWTKYLLEKGAASVVGIDISARMVENATQDAQTSWPVEICHKATFYTGDCTEPLSIPGSNKDGEDNDGLFDLVFGAWLLNYAATSTELRAMWLNIHSHLRPGGRFIGITPNVFLNPKDNPVEARYGYSVEPLHEVEDGWKCRLVADTAPERISFEMFHLRGEVYERTAREAGLVGLRWEGHVLPEGDGGGGGGGGDRGGEGFWDAFEERPSFEICFARRLG